MNSPPQTYPHPRTEPLFDGDFQAREGGLEGKCPFGQFLPKIDRIYSNDSNIETAEESLHDYNDPAIRTDSPPLLSANFQKQSSVLKQDNHSILQFRKYQSDLIKTNTHDSLLRSDMERQSLGLPVQFDRNLLEGSIIIEEDRESNQSFKFDAENLTLQVNSLLKCPKQRVQHSFLINTRSQMIASEEERKMTLNEIVRETMHEGITQAKRSKQEDKIGGLSESRARKNACLKKKVTLTLKENSQASFQEEQGWQTKSYKKVVFKSSENQYPSSKPPKQPKQSSEKVPKSPLKTQLNSKKTIKRGQSIISICLTPKQQSHLEPADASTPLKSTRTLHDLGSNHLIYRLKRTDKSARERACQSIEVQTIEEQRRESEVFALIKKYPHRNILKLHSMSKSIDIKTDRTVLLQTIDFYPKNLEQYLIDLPQNAQSPQQTAIQRKIILFQVLKGLNFLHSNKITHRNLTPYSILINESLQTVISNFSSIDSPSLNRKIAHKCDWLIRPPQIILQPNFLYTSSGDIWQFGCLAVYMLKMKMPFVEYSDASLIIEMSKCIGRITTEDRNAIGFKNFKKFIFPSLRRESMGRSFKCDDRDLVDMLRKVFVFNPYKRATAVELMKCKYFDELREGVRINDLFEFGREEITEVDRQEVLPFWMK